MTTTRLAVAILAALSAAGTAAADDAGTSADALEYFPLPRFEPAKQRRHKPWVDFGRTEANLMIGGVHYSDDFDAEEDSGGAGLIVRAPTPALLENLGVFGQLFFTRLSRDLQFYYEHPSGNVFTVAGGVDYTLELSSYFYLRPQAGGLYAKFRRIDGVEDGFGGLVGIQAGLRVTHPPVPLWITATGQWINDGDDWFLIGTAGVQFGF